MNILFFAGELLAFLFLLFWLVFLPGFFLLTKTTNLLSKIEKMTLGISLGVVIFTLLVYICGLLKIVYAAYFLISAFNIFNLGRFTKILNKNHFSGIFSILKKNWGTVLLIIASTIFSGSLLFLSGWESSGSILFTEYRDAFWHLGLMKELMRSIPPLHPGFAPEPLTNYHFFTHLFGAGFLLLPVFNSLDFYFRILPFFLVLLYVFNLYIVGRLLTKSQLGGNLAIIFGLLTGSFAYVLPLFLKYQGFNWHESSFWLSQPFSMVINPSFALSSSLLFSVIFLLYKMQEQRKNNLFLPILLLAGTLISFKVYAGILILGGLGASCLWQAIIEKKLTFFKLFLASVVVSFFLFFPISGAESGRFLFFLPGWYLRSMVESHDRVQIIDWILRENTYLFSGNTFGVIRLRLYEFIIYMVGNLGIRILGLAIVFKQLRKLLHLEAINVFLLTILFAGFFIPMFFVQDGSIANTLQFSYYALEIMSLYFVLWLTNLLISKSFTKKIIIIVLLILLAVPTSFKIWSDYLLVKQFTVIDKSQLEALNFLKYQTPKEAIIIVPATHWYTNSLIVGTLSDRRIYYSDRLMAENTHKNFHDREDKVSKFFKSEDRGGNTSLLKDSGISYVYVDKEAVLNFKERFYPVVKVFSNERFTVYKVI